MSKKYKICLDPGHGGSDPGATNGRYLEKDAALDIVFKLAKLLALAGVDVIYTRTRDEDVELRPRTDYANAAGADYFISIHLNSAGAKQANGIETYAYNTTVPESYKLAQVVQRALIAATGANDRGVRTANFHVLRETTMPAILVETGFISNDAEAAALFTDGYQETVATAICNGICEYLGLEVQKDMKRYNYLMEIPAGEFRDTIKTLMAEGIIKNSDGQLDLSYDMIRMFVINNRAGAYK